MDIIVKAFSNLKGGDYTLCLNVLCHCGQQSDPANNLSPWFCALSNVPLDRFRSLTLFCEIIPAEAVKHCAIWSFSMHRETHTPHACMVFRECVPAPDAFAHTQGWDEWRDSLIPRRLPLLCASLWRETHAHLSNWAPWFTTGRQLPSVQQNWHESVICPQLCLKQQQQQQLQGFREGSN